MATQTPIFHHSTFEIHREPALRAQSFPDVCVCRAAPPDLNLVLRSRGLLADGTPGRNLCPPR
jgi:hypothetical protein